MPHVDFPALLGVVTRAFQAGSRVVVVDSPPGAGKTMLIEDLAAERAGAGYAAAVTMPGVAQCLEFVERLRASAPSLSIRLWIGGGHRLRSGLARDARLVGDGSYVIGHSPGPTVEVGTVSKLGLLDISERTWDFLFVDEAYQVTFSGYEPLLDKARCHVLVGDPGQLRPTVEIDTQPFETLAHRPHLPAPVELARHEPGAATFRLAQTYRFPQDTVSLLQPYYPKLPFTSALPASARQFHFRQPPTKHAPIDQALDALAMGSSLVAVTLQASSGEGTGIDHDLVDLSVEIMVRLLRREPELPGGRIVHAGDIGCIEPHVAVSEAIRRSFSVLSSSNRGTMVNTPEVWQGLQRPFIVTSHPVSEEPSEFDLDPGRFCVALSRHQFGCIVVARDNVGALLDEARLDAAHRPLGTANRNWHGLQAHRAFWSAMNNQGHVFTMT